MKTLANVTLIILLTVVASPAQTARRRPPVKGHATADTPSNHTPRKATDPTDSFWSAQRSLEAALAQLETYLRQSPSGERATTARQQLEALRELTLAASKPEWVQLALGPATDSIWRIASVMPEGSKTRVVIEIKCSQQGSECGFLSFDSHPLVLTDNRGRYYPMLDGGTRPEGVSANRAPFDDQWRFQAGRVLKLEVSFASLLTGTANVKLQYRDNNQATPANFSLVRNK